jgi:hypothetical protein
MSVINPKNQYDIQICSAASTTQTLPEAASGVFMIFVWGTLSGTVSLEGSPDDGTTWLPYGVTFTATGGIAGPIFLARGQRSRLVIAGGTVSAILSPVP